MIHEPLIHEPLAHEPLTHEPLTHEPLAHEPLAPEIDAPPTTGRLSVRDVLALDLVAGWGAEVVAGAGQLDRPVRWLHVAEAADVAVMLAGGEMVLTTGLLLAGDEPAQRQYIESMRNADASAVVLGLGRAFRTTPEPMRLAAERCGVPLIVLHRPAPFARLTEEVHSRLINGRFTTLNLSDRIRSSLTGLNLSGASLQQLLDEIASYAGCPAVLTNLAHRVLGAAGERGPLNELLRDWDRVSRHADSAPAAGPDGCITVPVEVRGQLCGRLVLFGYQGAPECGRVIARRGAEALVMHRLLGSAAPFERAWSWEEQATAALLTDLASGAARPEQLLPRARAAGLPVSRRTFVPLIVRPLGPLVEGAVSPELVDRILAEETVAGLAAALATDSTAVLLSVPTDQDADACVQRFAVRLHQRLAALGRTAVVGAGYGCTVLDQLPGAFTEAVHVADAALAAPPSGPLARLRDVRLRGLVRLLRDEPELQAFIDRELGPLLDHPHLLDVLRTYLTTGRNKSLAAQSHHVSRPALYRRLQSIETLLGVDLDDWEQLTSLYVALLAHEAQRG